MADIKAIAAELVALTVQEVIDLKNELKETYGTLSSRVPVQLSSRLSRLSRKLAVSA